ncbi:MAG: sigma-70 family RNA polymerase sigma factor [Bacteroidales bacterium]|nr:sigma-70 family RNA polymerase sigma factor [Bacteroidales bacterium]
MAKTGSKLTDFSETDLIKAALGEDAILSQAAFYTLYARYNKGVRSHIACYVKDAEEIEDICMETFAKAFKQLSTYKDDNRFSTWIFRIARNTSFDHLSHEKARTHKAVSLTIDYAALEHVDIPSEDESPEEEVIGSQDHESFLDCVEALPELYRDVAKYCFIDNLGYKEIAAKTDLPINTVKTRIKRAKEMVIKRMAEEDQNV